MVMRHYKTSKGTELPLLNLRGKEYLEVKFRLVWFREDHPDWSIETELVSVTDVSAYARATIRDEKSRVIATSHKFESIQGFPDFIEKAETGAIGRALALIGYGTQFCADELDEGKRIVDAPVAQIRPRQSERSRQGHSGETPEAQEASDAEPDEVSSAVPAEQSPHFEPGDYRINFGRKYKGRKLKDIPRKELENYLQWLETTSIREGTVLSHQVRLLKEAFHRMYESNEEVVSH